MSHHFDSTSMWLYRVALHGMVFICMFCNYFLSDSPSSLRSPAKIKIACGLGGRGSHESSGTALATETRFLIRRGSGASIWIWVLKWGRLGIHSEDFLGNYSDLQIGSNA